MSGALSVGNDVVDLTDPRTRDKAADRRFRSRVLSDDENELLDRALSADQSGAMASANRFLWALWAAKEAAFKVATKVRARPPVFVHADFRVTCVAADADPWPTLVAWEDLEIAVRVDAQGEMLHAVAFAAPGTSVPDTYRIGSDAGRIDQPGTPWSAPLDTLLTHFTDQERDAVHSHPSAAVRLAARAAIAGDLDVAEDRLEIVCAPGPTGRRPPTVLMDGATCAVDVSLSHGGQWIAWAWSVEK